MDELSSWLGELGLDRPDFAVVDTKTSRHSQRELAGHCRAACSTRRISTRFAFVRTR